MGFSATDVEDDELEDDAEREHSTARGKRTSSWRLASIVKDGERERRLIRKGK